MSLIISVHVPTGIVLSGDSRTTGTISQQVPNPAAPATTVNVQTNIVISDSAEKVFLLNDRFGVGTYGDAFVNNMPVAHHIDQFQSQNPTPPTTTQALANSLLAFFRTLLPVPRIGLIVEGYDGTDPWVIGVDVHANTTQRANLVAGTGQINYGIVSGGETAIVSRLLSQSQFNPPFQAMNLQDAVDFSRHLIRSTIDQMKFEPRFATVGGPIDTLIVTAGQARFLSKKSLTI